MKAVKIEGLKFSSRSDAARYIVKKNLKLKRSRKTYTAIAKQLKVSLPLISQIAAEYK